MNHIGLRFPQHLLQVLISCGNLIALADRLGAIQVDVANRNRFNEFRNGPKSWSVTLGNISAAQ